MDSAWSSWSMGLNLTRVIGGGRKGIWPQSLLCSNDKKQSQDPLRKKPNSEFLTGYEDFERTCVGPMCPTTWVLSLKWIERTVTIISKIYDSNCFTFPHLLGDVFVLPPSRCIIHTKLYANFGSNTYSSILHCILTNQIKHVKKEKGLFNGIIDIMR